MWIFWLIVFLALLSIGYAAGNGAPWVPTRKNDIKRFLDIAKLTKDDVLYELGCGDGRSVIKAVKASGCRGVGVELAWPMALIAYIRTKIAHVSVKIMWKDARHVDLSEATVVYLFLMPNTYTLLKPRLEKVLKPGTRVISYVWPIKGWQAETIDKSTGKDGFFAYIIGKT